MILIISILHPAITLPKKLKIINHQAFLIQTSQGKKDLMANREELTLGLDITIMIRLRESEKVHIIKIRNR